MLKSMRFASKLFYREVMRGEWLIIFFALFIAVSALTTVRFYTENVIQQIERQSAEILGGDLVVSNTTPISPAWIEKTRELKLNMAQAWSFQTVVQSNNQLELVNVQAISPTYPLTGKNKITLNKNEIAVENRLLPLLKLKLHATLKIGANEFHIQQVLPSNVAGNTGWLLAPQVTIRLADVPATKVILPGSRVDYRLIVAGNKAQLNQFKTWLMQIKLPNQRIIEATSQQLTLINIIKKADNYIQLILLICFVMCSIAIFQSVQFFMTQHAPQIALWRCLGASKSHIIQHFVWQLILLSLLAGSAGIIVGYIAQYGLAALLQKYLQITITYISIKPFILGFAIALLMLFGLAYPLLNELPMSSPLLLWRNIQHMHTPNKIYSSVYLTCLLSFIWYLMNFSFFSLFFISVLGLFIAFLYALSLALIKLTSYLEKLFSGPIRRGLCQITHHVDSISLQFISIGLIFTLLMTTYFIKNNLLTDWQTSLPKTAPNYFAINIAQSDLSGIKQLLTANQVAIDAIYPMLKARLISLNQQPILQAVPKNAVNNNALHRELNLSWMDQYPTDNKIIQGQKWGKPQHGQALVSVEQRLADELGLKLGDKLTFQSGSYVFSATITNIRAVTWTSFHPNFYMIFSPGFVHADDATFITSFYLPANKTLILNQLVQQFPNITVIDIASIMQQVQQLLSNLSYAVQYLFIFVIVAGILILITSRQTIQSERRTTYYLLHVLGASKRFIRISICTEIMYTIFAVLVISFGLSWALYFMIEKIFFD